MYDVSGCLPVETVSPGTNLLAIGPPMLGMRGFAYRFLARGLDAGDGCVVVTTDRDAATVADAVAGYTDTDSIDRLGIVDATGGDDYPDSAPYAVDAAGSPADLTGIGIGVSKLLEEFHDDGAKRYRLVLDSLSSLLVYAGFERLYRFMHTVTNQIGQIDGISLSLISADTDRQDADKLNGLFDGAVEFRQGDSAVEGRLRGRGEPTGWTSFESEPAPVESVAGHGPSASEPSVTSAVESFTSLHDAIERVTATDRTLTLCNFTGGEEMLSDIRDYFERLNVDVRTDEMADDEPSNVALLHRGAECVAMNPVTELYGAMRWEGRDDADEPSGMVQPDIMKDVFRQEYTVENGGKLQMVRISRLIEMRALEAGTGTLHTGFQRLDRVEDELGTHELYRNIAETDVTVHLYGQAGFVPDSDAYTLHTAEGAELADSWFVVYDGGGRDVRAGALVSEEIAPKRYSGFWTYQPGLVAAVDEYLESTYSDV
jgi:KaiC/GvpD/RAD55 family RecA-like ATPase